ncbi:MAG: SDR family oxidoreductase [Planctomycetota bacterium]
MKRLIFGCGYLGRRVAEHWKNLGDSVHACTRNSATADQFEGNGLLPIVADITDRSSLTDLPEADSVLFSVGMDRSRYDDIRDVYVKGLQNVLDSLHRNIKQFIYISSTGVYGNFDGQWVDESAVTEPRRDGGKACLEAEQLLQTSWLSDRLVILRFSGIYGPGRIPTQATIASKNWDRLSGQGYLNLIQVDDGAKSVALIANQPKFETFHISDGNPVIRKTYYDEVAKLLGSEPIPWTNETADPTKRGAVNKRISNAKFVSHYPNFNFDFPDYRTGLRHAMETN